MQSPTVETTTISGVSYSPLTHPISSDSNIHKISCPCHVDIKNVQPTEVSTSLSKQLPPKKSTSPSPSECGRVLCFGSVSRKMIFRTLQGLRPFFGNLPKKYTYFVIPITSCAPRGMKTPFSLTSVLLEGFFKSGFPM